MSREEVLSRLKSFFDENGMFERCKTNSMNQKIFKLLLSLSTGLAFESGWDVEIKLRKGGNSAGTSDVVRIRALSEITVSCLANFVHIYTVLLFAQWQTISIEDRGRLETPLLFQSLADLRVTML